MTTFEESKIRSLISEQVSLARHASRRILDAKRRGDSTERAWFQGVRYARMDAAKVLASVVGRPRFERAGQRPRVLKAA